MTLKIQEEPLRYSKGQLLKLYGVDLFAAASSSALVSPFIAIVDRSIVENLNGKTKLMNGIQYGFRSLTSRPFQFASSRQFRVVFGVYFATYATANLVETTCEQYGVGSSMYKLVSTSLVNILVCVYKDKVFTRLFGVVAAANQRAFPKWSYFLFTIRDSLTIAASFTMPSHIANTLQSSSFVSASEKSAQVAAQLICPAAVQFVSTPVHLLALDLYNRPAASVALRAHLLGKEYLKSSLARIGRIGPAFGFGGIGNTYIRNFRKNILI